jgi:hypothetical protein
MSFSKLKFFLLENEISFFKEDNENCAVLLADSASLLQRKSSSLLERLHRFVRVPCASRKSRKIYAL